MTGTFLAPHNDDEALFGAYTLLKHKPTVVVVFRCDPFPQRFEESVQACKLLGVDVHNWAFPERYAAHYADDITRKIAALKGPVWAPLPEPDGHAHHNLVGEAASACDDVHFYTTYSKTARTVGDLVVPERGWEQLKLAALECYVSQISRIAGHTARGLDEYVA